MGSIKANSHYYSTYNRVFESRLQTQHFQYSAPEYFDMSRISQQLEQVQQRITEVARAAGRDPAAIQLLAISKTRPIEDIQAAIAAGQYAFGENYLQDALPKITALAGTEMPLEWHFIGAIQSNKTRDIASHFDWVHTLEREKIARRLSEQRPDTLPPLQVCVQVNISGEASKSGISPSDVEALAASVAHLPGLQLRGLMAIPAATQDVAEQRAAFSALNKLYQSLIKKGYELDTLSMGMSNDLEAAILEGSTQVRIGTAIFGSRK